MPFSTLNPEKIIDTACRLQLRVAERFPNSSLYDVSLQLAKIAMDCAKEANDITRPIWWARLPIALIVVVGCALILFVDQLLSFESVTNETYDFVPVAEAGMNIFIWLGIALYAIIRLEDRIKQKRASKSLYPLRSIIHVIDMHQLTKDPATLRKGFIPTQHSPVRRLNAHDMSRYLDYCAEMSAIVGKVAALYTQSIADNVVEEAVNDIETLSTNLSSKIWQKIMLIEMGEGQLRAPVNWSDVETDKTPVETDLSGCQSALISIK